MHTRTGVYQIGYHIVFCTKYRKKVLVGNVEQTLKRLLLEVAAEKGFAIGTLETDQDHVHLFVSAPPHYSISVLMKWLKGISAWLLLASHPELKQQLWRGHLWNPSYYVGTVGDLREDVVRRYIDNQKTQGAREKTQASGRDAHL